MTGSSPSTAERMVERARAFLDALAPEERARTQYPFPADEERRRWYYTPTEQGGLPLVEMQPYQHHLAHQLVGTGLSLAGYATASTIMGLENTLAAVEEWQTLGSYPGRPAPSRGRDPNMYFVSVFGDPGERGWGWRFGGHHLSLHYTILNGHVASPTPSFFGADPADAELAGGYELRPLGRLEDLGRELLRALNAAQRSRAVLTPIAPRDLVMANRPVVEDGASLLPTWELFGFPQTGRRLELQRATYERSLAASGFSAADDEAVRFSQKPKGLPASDMTAAQRDILTALLRRYIERMSDEIAEAELAKVQGSALDAIHFAWAGGSERKQPHYYRLQGPRLLVEYDNTQRDVNHIHSVWRDPEGDFGADLLAQHYAAAH